MSFCGRYLPIQKKNIGQVLKKFSFSMFISDLLKKIRIESKLCDKKNNFPEN